MSEVRSRRALTYICRQGSSARARRVFAYDPSRRVALILWEYPAVPDGSGWAAEQQIGEAAESELLAVDRDDNFVPVGPELRQRAELIVNDTE